MKHSLLFRGIYQSLAYVITVKHMYINKGNILGGGRRVVSLTISNINGEPKWARLCTGQSEFLNSQCHTIYNAIRYVQWAKIPYKYCQYQIKFHNTKCLMGQYPIQKMLMG